MTEKEIELQKMADPYKGKLRTCMFRLNACVDENDVNTIKSVAPSRGVIQTIIADYVNSLAAELRARGITYYSPENNNLFVEIVKRRASFGPVGGVGGGNDTTKATGVRPASPATPAVKPNAPRQTRVRSKGKQSETGERRTAR